MNIAVAGFRHGHIGSIINAFRQQPETVFVGAAEDEPEEYGATAEKAGIKITHRDVTSLLEETDCDVLLVGDYYTRRGQQVIRALNAGKHVFCDKPLCTSLEELQEIRRLSDEKKLSVFVALTLSLIHI